MMLEMKRVVLLLSGVLLTCAAPLQQNNELSTSQGSQVTSRITQFRGTSGSDIIITAPAGFGKPNENGQSTVTVSLRDENTNVTVDVVSFVFSVSSEETIKVKFDDSDGGFGDEGMQDNGAGPGKAGEKNNTDNDEEASEEGFDPTAGPEVLNSDEELDKSEEEAPNPKDDKSDEDQIRSTSSQSDTRVNSEESDTSDYPKVFETKTTLDTSSLQEDSNESDSGSEHRKIKVHTDLSDRTETSVLHHLPGKLTGRRSVFLSTLIHEEITSAGTNSRSDNSSEEGQTVPTHSEPMLGPVQTASELSSSMEEETDGEYKNSVTDPPLRKTPSLNSSPESMVNIEVVKNEGLPTTFFSGSDVYPEYVNDEWQYDPRYYDPYRNHPEYDPYGAGYDPYGAGYDPYQAGYDPYGKTYDAYHAGYDPYGAGYDPYGTRYDPYQEGYDNQDPYHETGSEDPRHDVEQETTPAYSVEDNESRPTEISNSLDNSHSEEQPQLPSVSPSSTPVSFPEGSENMDSAHNMASEANSSSIETSNEMGLQTSEGPDNHNSPPGPAVSNSEEGTETRAEGKKMAATGSSSSEESIEGQNPMDQPGNQGTPDPAIQTSSHMSVVQVSHNTQVVHNKEEPQSQSPAELTPEFSSEEDDPLANTIKHVMALALNGGSNEEGPVAGTNPDSTLSGNNISENNQNEESNESTTDSPGISAEMTPESMHFTTESPTLDAEAEPTGDSLVSNEDTSSENLTPNPSSNLHTTTQSSRGLGNSAEANANTADDSEENQESQSFIPSTVQHTENSSDEENTRDRKSSQGIIGQLPVESPAKIIAANLWTSFLQALNVPIANQSGQSAQKYVRRSQSTRRYHHRGNRRQKVSSSEERK